MWDACAAQMVKSLLGHTFIKAGSTLQALCMGKTMRDELRTNSVEEDACDAAPSCSSVGADTAAVVAEPPKYIKGRLKAKLAFWKLFRTSAWVLSWITDGYRIPWGEMGLPPPQAFANQQGALRHHDFVIGEIADLLARGSIIQRQTDHPW